MVYAEPVILEMRLKEMQRDICNERTHICSESRRMEVVQRLRLPVVK